MNRVLDRVTLLLWLLCLVAIPAALWMVFQYAPEESVMGAPQRIFYFHVPVAIAGFASVFVLLGASIAYLRTRNLRWDNLSRAATETALVFCVLVLVTGSLWAKPIWGVWWTWEAKLTTTLILCVLLAACLLVRGYSENRDLGARLAAVLGVVAAVDIPVIYKATEWFRGIHPVVFKPNQPDAVEARMGSSLQMGMLAVFLLFGLLLVLRYRVLAAEDRSGNLAERVTRSGEV